MALRTYTVTIRPTKNHSPSVLLGVMHVFCGAPLDHVILTPPIEQALQARAYCCAEKTGMKTT
jgi:hypothetical protein